MVMFCLFFQFNECCLQLKNHYNKVDTVVASTDTSALYA